jgi:outer membrane protein OmpA-like peptidoglycan-associated protein
MVVNDTLTPDRMVREFLLGKGVTISNVKYKGEVDALGVFTDSNGLTGFRAGLILSNGRSDLLPGKNSRPNAGANFGHHFFFDEDFITQANMCDGAVLEFDFVPSFDSVAFRFVFGSEEYPEFVGKNFNDVFALLIKPKTARGKYKNIGSLPNGTTVMINNVNAKRNAEWYVANDYYNAPLYNELEYDGLTKPIVAAMKVTPLQPYHIKILIADLGDCEYDSGVLLEALSFSSYSTAKPRKPITRTYHFNFENSSYQLSESDTKRMRKLSDSLSRFAYDSIVVIGHTDSTGSELGNQTLSKKRAETVVTYLSMGKIQCYRWVSKGAGSSQPVQANNSEQGKAANRRVEILFYQKKR